jgi:hypothetical protein
MSSRALFAVLLVLALGAAAPAFEKKFEPPRAFHAKTFPAHDEHPLEKVTIAADPYDLPEKDAAFTVPFRKEGLLPIHLLISNDSGKPIALAGLKVELITVDRVKIGPAEVGDIYRKVATMKNRPTDPRPYPLPIPRGAPKPSVKREYQEEIEAAMFKARAVEAGSTEAGFFFFDVDGLDHPLNGARLFISGLRDDQGQELMYFEISMEKYLTYRPSQP